MTLAESATTPAESREVVRVRDLSVFARATRVNPERVLVDGISFEIRAGEVYGLVGESGSGKSMTASAIARLLPPLVRLGAGSGIKINEREVTSLSDKDFRRSVQPQIGFVFQNPTGSLNPAMTVGAQIAEAVHAPRGTARARAIEMMDRVGIPDPASRYGDYPHQFSGGMCQRIAIAIALAHSPRLLIADEPTSSLDVTVQAQVLSLVRELASEEQIGVLFITHDLAVVANLCDRVGVMRTGSLIETADVEALFASPQNPYTASLIEASAALALPEMTP